MAENNGSMNFWEHLDEFRGVLIRIAAVTLAAGIAAFFFKEVVFDFVLAPKSDDFITYRILKYLCDRLGMAAPGSFEVEIINTGLAQQFMIHIKTAVCIGVIAVFPYILQQLFSFISPGLYQTERRVAVRILWSGYIMFMLGIALNYYLLFPLTFRFLGTYQVSYDVTNLINLESYMSTLVVMSISLGVMFELPVLAWLMAKAGFVDDKMLKRFRRHSIVAILIVCAIITPTSDIITLLIVSLPIYILYETSIIIVKHSHKRE